MPVIDDLRQMSAAPPTGLAIITRLAVIESSNFLGKSARSTSQNHLSQRHFEEF